ncbi:hypothetical protein [Acidipropionibacterium acidipropionici]|uniref:hypothetical protein n=1 Tax=Acidipropionibacterium acidipropionici TaxID=1748 RepID=UPI0012B6783A|nr:hypothetical protein [Acidipropionibacterium acidipropionici]
MRASHRFDSARASSERISSSADRRDSRLARWAIRTVVTTAVQHMVATIPIAP